MENTKIASERTLVHGRNIMAIAGALCVLAWVPGINVGDFHPFGFEFDEKSKISAWALMAGVLVYYVIRFCADSLVDYRPWLYEHTGESDGAFKKIWFGPEARNKITRVKEFNSRHQLMLNLRLFILLDFGLPIVLAFVGLVAAIGEIRCLV